MRADPIGEALRPACLGIGVARGAERGDEDLRPPDLAGGAVDHLDGAPGVVGEQLLAGEVRLAHPRRQPAGPLPVMLAEPAVAEAVRRPAAILVPEQRQRHVGPAQLEMDRRPIRLRPRRGPAARRRRKQPPLQLLVAQLGRQRPRQPRPPGPRDVVARPRRADADGRRDLTLRQPADKSQPQHFPGLPHGQSLGGHPPLLGQMAKGGRLPASEVVQRHQLPAHRTGVVAIVWNARSRSPGTGGRDRLESVVAISWIQWSRSPGTRTSDSASASAASSIRCVEAVCESMSARRPRARGQRASPRTV